MNDFRTLAKFIAKVNVPKTYFNDGAHKNYKIINHRIGIFKAEIEVREDNVMQVCILRLQPSGNYSYLGDFTYTNRTLRFTYFVNNYYKETLTEEFIKANKLLTK